MPFQITLTPYLKSADQQFPPKLFSFSDSARGAITLGGAHTSMPAPSCSNGVFADSRLLPKHAELLFDRGSLSIRALAGRHSPYSYLVNTTVARPPSDHHRPYPLRHGDVLELGTYDVDYTDMDDPSPMSHIPFLFMVIGIKEERLETPSSPTCSSTSTSSSANSPSSTRTHSVTSALMSQSDLSTPSSSSTSPSTTTLSSRHSCSAPPISPKRIPSTSLVHAHPGSPRRDTPSSSLEATSPSAPVSISTEALICSPRTVPRSTSVLTSPLSSLSSRPSVNSSSFSPVSSQPDLSTSVFTSPSGTSTPVFSYAALTTSRASCNPQLPTSAPSLPPSPPLQSSSSSSPSLLPASPPAVYRMSRSTDHALHPPVTSSSTLPSTTPESPSCHNDGLLVALFPRLLPGSRNT
ncbi:hypothetical protein A4X13_0g8768, partial [Tilletia indica]